MFLKVNDLTGMHRKTFTGHRKLVKSGEAKHMATKNPIFRAYYHN